MVESLRRWGGAFADAPCFAVTPRHGPRLSSSTLKQFSRLNVHYIREIPGSLYPWFRFYNKPLTLTIVEKVADTDTICWLDSDVLIVGEPEALWLNGVEDFTACSSDKEMGSSGTGDAFEPLWRANCDAVGVDIENLPWVITEAEGFRIRLYWNGGIFVYRRSTKFGRRYLATCTKLMDARNVTAAAGFSVGLNEMSAIGLSVHLMGLKWRSLPYSHNYIMSSRTHQQFYREDQLRIARIIHYHDGMWPWFWDILLQCLQDTHPSVAKWLAGLGPIRNEAPIFNRVWGKALRIMRDREQRAYIKTCHIV
jgi:hypothetical protein